MRCLNSFITIGVLFFVLSGCGSESNVETATTTQKKLPGAASGTSELSTALKVIDESAIDPTVDRCEDFYHYACGAWLNQPLPAEKTSIYRDYPLTENIKATLKSIVTSYAAGDFSTPSTYAGLLGDYYSSCMNEYSHSDQNLAVLNEKLKSIDKILDKSSLASSVADLQLLGANVLFNFSSAQDFNDATKVVAMADQGGMALPDRDYYMKDDSDSKKLLQDYSDHIQRSFSLLGYSNLQAKEAARVVLALETRLASHALPLDDRRDPSILNNPIGREGLKKITPNFDWDTFFSESGIGQVQAVTVLDLGFYKNLDKILISTNLEDLKTYLKWELVRSMMDHLSNAFLQESFGFWGKTLNGQQEMLPQWKRCLGAYEGSLTEALGEAYVKKVFSKENKDRVSLMLKSIKEAFLRNLKTVDWLDDSTRATAIDKLQKVGEKIGYPDKWKDLSGLHFTRTSFLQNLIAERVFESKRQLAKIGNPVQRWEWDMPPQEINAYYNPNLNEVVFPAGILQPPYFDMMASDGANYGNTGGTMGHELTHGFDDQGSRYDAYGNVKNWWPKEVRDRFNEHAQCLVKQVESYPTGIAGLSIRGQATLGENIADQGGTKLALSAFLEEASKRKPAPDYAGFNELQQFFLAYAQGWCNHQTTESLRNQLLSDVHPPAEYRTNGVLRNIPLFAEAFRCEEGKSKMAPKDRCGVW